MFKSHLKPGITFCRERERNQLQIAQSWRLFLGRNPRCEEEQQLSKGTAASWPGLRDNIGRDWQVVVHSHLQEAPGCFLGKGTVC